MGIMTEAHDPSGPSGHLPTHARGEECSSDYFPRPVIGARSMALAIAA
jgi:hypothetical protein